MIRDTSNSQLQYLNGYRMEINVESVTGRISINAINAKAAIISGITTVSLGPSDNLTIKDLKQKLYEKKVAP